MSTLLTIEPTVVSTSGVDSTSSAFTTSVSTASDSRTTNGLTIETTTTRGQHTHNFSRLLSNEVGF